MSPEELEATITSGGSSASMREQVGLEVFAFRTVFLDEVHAAQRAGQVGIETQRLGAGAGGHAAELGQHRPGGGDARARQGFRVGGGIADHDFESIRQEQRGPAGADGARADNGDAAYGGGGGRVGHARLRKVSKEGPL